jgi:DNA-binding MarR family transcriptional regulator
LASIEKHGPLTIGSLADHERVAPPSTTKVVSKLEAAGLVVRRAHESDGRVSMMSASDAGRALLAESRERKTAWLSARLAELDGDERATLAAALDVLDRLTALGVDEQS